MNEELRQVFEITENLAGEYRQSLLVEGIIESEEQARASGYPVGDKYWFIPQPATPKQAFERLIKLYAQEWSEALQRDFVYTFPITEENIKSQLQILDDFIEKAKNKAKEVGVADKAFSVAPHRIRYVGGWLDIKNDEQLEYIRIIRGYYTKNMCSSAVNSIECRVYAKYVLYRQWLQNQLNTLEECSHKITKKETNELLGIQTLGIINEILTPLGGYNPQHKLIMSKEDFSRLVDYTIWLVQNDSLPENINVIEPTNISIGHIRFTFHRLHKRLFTTREIKPAFYMFLHRVFKDFENQKIETTIKKFATRPKSYLADFNIS
ncbi:hypothetical protein GCM10028807_51700 [Spirosoma daeguense]